MSGVVAAVLAAGGGSRFAGPGHKLLAELDGVPLVRRALDAALDADIGEVVVVWGSVTIGAIAPEGVRLVENPNWRDGMATSLAAAVAAVAPTGCEHLVVGLGDQPLVDAASWSAVAAARRRPIALATYAGTRGHPVRLGRAVWPLLPLRGDVGARQVMSARPELVEEVPCVGPSLDVDTVEDLVGAAALASKRRKNPWN